MYTFGMHAKVYHARMHSAPCGMNLLAHNSPTAEVNGASIRARVRTWSFIEAMVPPAINGPLLAWIEVQSAGPWK